MPVLTRSQAWDRQPPTHAASSRASTPQLCRSTSSSEISQQPSLKEGVNFSDSGGRPSTLAVGNERPLVVHTCREDCFTCAALICKNEYIFNIRDRKQFVIDIKTDEVHCKLQNYIYLLTCIHYGVQYVSESITSLNEHSEEENQDVKYLFIIIGMFAKI